MGANVFEDTLESISVTSASLDIFLSGISDTQPVVKDNDAVHPKGKKKTVAKAARNVKTPTTAGASPGITKSRRKTLENVPKVDWPSKYKTTNGKEVKCNECGATISSVDHYKRHYFNQHLGKCYRCDVCKIDSKCKKTYYHHVPTCHGDRTKDPLVVFKLNDGTCVVTCVKER